MPVYNVGRYLPTCIQSIINQLFTDWELILVDDGSTDCSGVMCDEFAQKDNRIRVVHSKNGGPSSARNSGLNIAKGDFVTFVDSDDYVQPSFLNNFSYDSSLDFEIQGFRLSFEANSAEDKDIIPRETKVAPVSEIYSEAELLKLSRGPYCKLFKRAIIAENKVEFPLGIHFAEDAIFVKRYLTHCRGLARSIAKADYVYMHYQSSSSLTSKRHPGQMMYDVALMDYNLFKQLEQNWGGINIEAKKDFIHIRTLEFYNSICSILTEEGQTYSTCCAFLKRAKQGMFQKVKDVSNLPSTYQIVKVTLSFPTSLAVFILKTIFAIKKPAV